MQLGAKQPQVGSRAAAAVSEFVEQGWSKPRQLSKDSRSEAEETQQAMYKACLKWLRAECLGRGGIIRNNSGYVQNWRNQPAHVDQC